MSGSARTARLRARTLAKLGDVCDEIARLKGGQSATLAALPVSGGGGRAPADPLARAEWFKALLNATLRSLADGTHGRCSACSQPIPHTELDELPWADVCGPCALEAGRV